MIQQLQKLKKPDASTNDCNSLYNKNCVNFAWDIMELQRNKWDKEDYFVYLLRQMEPSELKSAKFGANSNICLIRQCSKMTYYYNREKKSKSYPIMYYIVLLFYNINYFCNRK